MRLLDAYLQETHADVGSMSSMSEPAAVSGSRSEGSQAESATTSSSKQHRFYVPALRKDRGLLGTNGIAWLANRRLFYDLRIRLFSGWATWSTSRLTRLMIGKHCARKYWRFVAGPLRCRWSIACSIWKVGNSTLKEELRSVRETQEQPANDFCDAGAECCDAPTVQQQIADGRKATTSV